MGPGFCQNFSADKLVGIMGGSRADRVSSTQLWTNKLRTCHRSQAIAACVENVLFKYTDHNKRKQNMTGWDTGSFVGVNSGTNEYPISKVTGIFSSATVRRHQGDKAYDPRIVQEATASYRDYVIEGLRSVPVRG